MKILVYPHEILRTKAKDVERIDGRFQEFIDAMFETMHRAEGIGLAANQVGRPVKLVVIDIPETEERKGGRLTLINPRITAVEGEESAEEGCLSVPGYGAQVRRPSLIQVLAYDREGKELNFQADGMLARCIQHELDHLDGICFVDRLNPVKKALFRKKWPKIRPKED